MTEQRTQARSARDFVALLDRERRFNAERCEEAGPPEIWRGELLIDGETSPGTIRSWPRPYLLARFSFKNETLRLGGQASGFTQDELLQLLKGLKAIDQQDEILAQYQDEFDAAIASFRR